MGFVKTSTVSGKRQPRFRITLFDEVVGCFIRFRISLKILSYNPKIIVLALVALGAGLLK